MTETYIKNTSKDLTSAIRGQLTYDDKVIEKIVGLALENVDGLLGVNGGFFANLKDKLVNTESVRDGVNVEVGKNKLPLTLILSLNIKSMCRLFMTLLNRSLKKK